MGPSERVTVTNVDQYNSILMIESLSPDHNGNYSCVARNVAAEVSHTQRLVVHGNPPLGPLQFARRPPDRPSFACACALRCVRANHVGRFRKWVARVRAACENPMSVVTNGNGCYILIRENARSVAKQFRLM